MIATAWPQPARRPAITSPPGPAPITMTSCVAELTGRLIPARRRSHVESRWSSPERDPGHYLLGDRERGGRRRRWCVADPHDALSAAETEVVDEPAIVA